MFSFIFLICLSFLTFPRKVSAVQTSSQPAASQPAASCLASQPGSQLAVCTAETFRGKVKKLKKIKKMKENIVFYQCCLVCFHFFELFQAIKNLKIIEKNKKTLIKHNVFFHFFDLFELFDFSTKSFSSADCQLAARLAC